MADDDAELETGYGPRTAAGDNLCNDFQQETARSFADLMQARGDRVERRADGLTMTDAGVPLPFWNRASLDAPITDLDRTLARVRAFFDDSSDNPFLLDSAWPTPDLRPHGFTRMGHPPLMVRPAGAPLPPPPNGLRIERVADAAAAADMERTLIDGYPVEPLQPFERVRMYTPPTWDAPGWHHFVGYADDRPVAAGSSYVGEQLLRVENIVSLPEVRGRGYGRAITAATIAVDESKPATLVASDPGRPVYEQLGFVAILRVTYWLGRRGAARA